MGKETNKPQTLTINDREYSVDDLTPEQIELSNHVLSLDNKIRNAQFSLAQLQGGRSYFMGMLDASLEAVDESEEVIE